MPINNLTLRNSGTLFFIRRIAWTKHLIIFNKTSDEQVAEGYGTYINLGNQKQVNLTYYNIFLGTRFPGEIYEHSTDAFDIIHAGVGIGHVFLNI